MSEHLTVVQANEILQYEKELNNILPHLKPASKLSKVTILLTSEERITFNSSVLSFYSPEQIPPSFLTWLQNHAALIAVNKLQAEETLNEKLGE